MATPILCTKFHYPLKRISLQVSISSTPKSVNQTKYHHPSKVFTSNRKKEKTTVKWKIFSGIINCAALLELPHLHLDECEDKEEPMSEYTSIQPDKHQG